MGSIQSISPRPIPSSLLAAIQRNIDAHRDDCYWQLYSEVEEKSFLGFSRKPQAAHTLLNSTIACLKKEHRLLLRSGAPTGRTEIASFYEALAILKKANAELSRELEAAKRLERATFEAKLAEIEAANEQAYRAEIEQLVDDALDSGIEEGRLVEIDGKIGLPKWVDDKGKFRAPVVN